MLRWGPKGGLGGLGGHEPKVTLVRQLAPVRVPPCAARVADDSPQRLHCVLVHWPRVSVYSQGMATMATMATLGTPPQQNISPVFLLVGSLSPPTTLPDYFIFKFQLGVAMVAMVAMPCEYTETRGQCTRTQCRRCGEGFATRPAHGGTRTGASSHACVNILFSSCNWCHRVQVFVGFTEVTSRGTGVWA